MDFQISKQKIILINLIHEISITGILIRGLVKYSFTDISNTYTI